MKLKRSRTLIILTLSIIICLVFSAVCLPPAEASSGKKTMYVPTKISTNYGRGIVYSYTIKYNKKGLPSVLAGREKYKYNKKGHLYRIDSAETGAHLYSIKTNKSGLPIKRTPLSNRHESYTTYYKYWKNGNIREVVSYSDGGEDYHLYDKYGNKTYTYYSSANSFGSSSYILKLDKKKNPILIKEKEHDSGYVECTYKIKYTYDRHGNIKKMKETVYEDNNVSKTVTTFKYKKVRVSKKNVKFMKYFIKSNTRPVTGD